MNAKLQELGAVFSSERFEENYLHRGGLLDERNAVLRLRRIGDKTYLTYKERIRSESEFKYKIEHETLVSDVEETENIIGKLGYKLSVIYEKHRKTWHLGKCEVVLDELPFGQYMEIEGEEEEILKVEEMLGATDLEPETRGYPRLTVKYGRQVGDVMEARFGRSRSA